VEFLVFPGDHGLVMGQIRDPNEEVVEQPSGVRPGAAERRPGLGRQISVVTESADQVGSASKPRIEELLLLAPHPGFQFHQGALAGQPVDDPDAGARDVGVAIAFDHLLDAPFQGRVWGGGIDPPAPKFPAPPKGVEGRRAGIPGGGQAEKEEIDVRVGRLLRGNPEFAPADGVHNFEQAGDIRRIDPFTERPLKRRRKNLIEDLVLILEVKAERPQLQNGRGVRLMKHIEPSGGGGLRRIGERAGEGEPSGQGDAQDQASDSASHEPGLLVRAIRNGLRRSERAGR
jgi:hypothetical protein